MTCYYPLSAFQDDEGKVHIGHERRGLPAVRTFELPCGKCIGCKLHRSRQWAIRCMHEAKLYDENSFITLTYDNNHLPEDASLKHGDFQKFMKRLRKHFSNRKIRFYMCGEYGENMGRPHYHACIFNLGFRDKLYFKRQGEITLYTSPTLEKLWGMGFCTVGNVTVESAGYVARYCTKVITGETAKDHYRILNTQTGEIHNRLPEYSKMSTQPPEKGTPGGIGGPWIHKHLKDVYPADEVIVNGRTTKPPRYYDTILKRVQLDDIEGYVQQKRYKRALKGAHDNTTDRLRVKEEIQYARIASYKPKGLL